MKSERLRAAKRERGDPAASEVSGNGAAADSQLDQYEVSEAPSALGKSGEEQGSSGADARGPGVVRGRVDEEELEEGGDEAPEPENVAEEEDGNVGEEDGGGRDEGLAGRSNGRARESRVAKRERGGGRRPEGWSTGEEGGQERGRWPSQGQVRRRRGGRGRGRGRGGRRPEGAWVRC